MGPTIPPYIPVIDFRRHSMVLQWQASGGTWSACDVPPALVHGVALIRASRPNICLFGRDGQLHFQVGPDLYALSESSPRIRWNRRLASFGLRRHFAVESTRGDVLFSHAYWRGRGDDFFSWFASRAADPEWRAVNGQRWSEGVRPAVLRSS
ncbi:MAG: hypothetical protein JWN43_2935 [Gammaproteobacteria bacterium]|nr:hypothetical protein [Gammaproteobacteria bacterium]